jgi:hypothetical protein
MTQEINDGSAYLKALRKSTSGQSGAAAAPAHEPVYMSGGASTAQSSESFEGAEKRRSRRYKCEGSAEVRKEGCDVRTWATFTDVSLHGCYVEAQATYPAGTLLHMKLDVNGIRFETKGKVRVSYPYLGMGIAFEDMSDDNTALLKRVLAGLSSPSVFMGSQASVVIPASGPIEGLPAITNPEAALRAMTEFFETGQVLMREEFVRLLKKTQK